MVAWRSTGSAHTGFGVLTTNDSYQGAISFGRMPTMSATAAINTATRAMAAFRLSPPTTCLTAHDDLAAIPCPTHSDIRAK